MKQKWMMIPVAKMIKADWNYKNENEKTQKSLVANIKKNNQIQNIIVREIDDDTFEIVNGNHRYDAFVTLGMEEVMCCNLGKIPLTVAKRIAIETNETRFASDPIKLAKLVDNLIKEFGMDDILETSPFSEKEIEEKQDMLRFNWDGQGSAEVDEAYTKEKNERLSEFALDLPEYIAKEFMNQVQRFKLALGVEDDNTAVQAMLQHLNQVDDETILELEL